MFSKKVLVVFLVVFLAALLAGCERERPPRFVPAEQAVATAIAETVTPAEQNEGEQATPQTTEAPVTEQQPTSAEAEQAEQQLPVTAAATEIAADTEGITAVALRPANVRSGPGTAWPVVAGLNAGDSVQLNGRTQDGEWLRIGSVWVWAELVDTDGDIDTLPVIETGAPPTSRLEPYSGPIPEVLGTAPWGALIWNSSPKALDCDVEQIAPQSGGTAISAKYAQGTIVPIGWVAGDCFEIDIAGTEGPGGKAYFMIQ
jgi:uncharacterized protein YraI